MHSPTIVLISISDQLWNTHDGVRLRLKNFVHNLHAWRRRERPLVADGRLPLRLR